MLVGSMMIPDPIMFTATMKVSWMRFMRLATTGSAKGAVACIVCCVTVLLLSNAVHEVASARGGGLESEPVNIGLEAGEFAIEVAGIKQVVLDRFGRRSEPLPGHDQGNAGRIRDHHHGQSAAHQIVDLDAFDTS